MSELTRPGVMESIEEIRANTARTLELLETRERETQGFAPIWRDEVEIVYPSRSPMTSEGDPRGAEPAPPGNGVTDRG